MYYVQIKRMIFCLVFEITPLISVYGFITFPSIITFSFSHAGVYHFIIYIDVAVCVFCIWSSHAITSITNRKFIF